MNAMKKWVVAGLIGLSSVGVSMGTTILIDDFSTAGTGVAGADGTGYYTPVGTGGNGIYSGAVRYFSGSNAGVPFTIGGGDVGQMTLTQGAGFNEMTLVSDPNNSPYPVSGDWFTQAQVYWTMGSYDGTYPGSPSYPSGTIDLSAPGLRLHVSGSGSYILPAFTQEENDTALLNYEVPAGRVAIWLSLGNADVGVATGFGAFAEVFIQDSLDNLTHSGTLGDLWFNMSDFLVANPGFNLSTVDSLMIHAQVYSTVAGKETWFDYSITGLEFTDGQGVPEPETVWMMLAVLASLAVTFRRQLMDLAGRFVKT